MFGSFFLMNPVLVLVFCRFNLVLVFVLLLSSGSKDVLQVLHDGGWAWACGRYRAHSLDG
jgi:hypothetical protein